MCFSTEASFGTGVILAVIGVATIKKARQPNRLLFASIPLLFSIQQIAEGLLWLSISNNEFSRFEKPSMYIFLFFAQVVWPLWIPLSIFVLEKRNRKIFISFLFIGIINSLFLLFCLFSYEVTYAVIHSHINYFLLYPGEIKKISDVFYTATTIIPLFILSLKGTKFLGIAILFSYFFSILFFQESFISVWCYFAALISIIIYFIIQKDKTENSKDIEVKHHKDPLIL